MWWSLVKAVLLSFFLTFIPFFDIPVRYTPFLPTIVASYLAISLAQPAGREAAEYRQGGEAGC